MSSLGPVILDLIGTEITAEEREILRHPQVGGIILFSRNYHSRDQLQNLIQQIRESSQEPLLITVDHEGGRVQRFREGFTSLPAFEKLGHIYTSDPARAKQIASIHAWLMASELLAFDIDLSFTPVLDLAKGISHVIGDRSFNRDPHVVAELGQAYIKGLQQAGMSAVGKHFPGHGSVAADSHTDIPIDDRDFNVIEQDDLIPFAKLSSQLNAIMPAHVIYSDVDKMPAGFSEFWLQRILRQQLEFEGVIFSDDLTMAGAKVAGSITERAQLALYAGCDSLLVCNDRKSAISVLEELEQQAYIYDPQSPFRLQKLSGRGTLSYQELTKTPAWKEAVNFISKL